VEVDLQVVVLVEVVPQEAHVEEALLGALVEEDHQVDQNVVEDLQAALAVEDLQEDHAEEDPAVAPVGEDHRGDQNVEVDQQVVLDQQLVQQMGLDHQVVNNVGHVILVDQHLVLEMRKISLIKMLLF